MKSTERKKKNANKRVFQGMPVSDAVAAIRVQPNKSDIKGAVRGDPCNCVYARCLKRQWNAENVWIFRSIAYLQLLDDEGNPIVERYNISKEARDYLTEFDNGEHMQPAGFELSPPTISKTLNYQNGRHSKNREKQREYSKNSRERAKDNERRFETLEPAQVNFYTRSGRGSVNFIQNREEAIQTKIGKVPMKKIKAA